MISSWESSPGVKAPRPHATTSSRARRGRLAPLEGIVCRATYRLERGEELYREGGSPEAAYLVQSGVLRVMVPTMTGRERLADLYGKGDVVGTSIFEGTAHAESVIAAQDATVAEIDLVATLAREPGRAAVSAALARQLNRSRALADDLGLPMGARICRILARVASRLGERVEMAADFGPTARLEWRHLPFTITHDDVALMAGCARVTATRILGELKEASVLDGHRGDYRLVPAALEEAADRYVYEIL